MLGIAAILQQNRQSRFTKQKGRAILHVCFLYILFKVRFHKPLLHGQISLVLKSECIVYWYKTVKYPAIY